MSELNEIGRRVDVSRWLWPVACLIVLTGYFGSWVSHPVAGLAITGLDLGEYVKFLQPVANGEISVWRQGFYTPLVTVSLACGLLAYRRTFAYPLLLRLALLFVGLVAALNMLPPAWSPAILRTPEFQLQAVFIAVCVATLAFSPLLALLPHGPVYALLAALTVIAMWLPASSFLRVTPAVAELYGHAIRPGLSLYVFLLGLLLLGVACWIGFRHEAESG